MNKMFEKHQPEMASALEARKQAAGVLEAAVAKVHGVEAALQRRQGALLEGIDSRMDALAAAVEQRRQELKQECAQVASAKAKRLVAHRDVLQNALAETNAVCAFAEEALVRGATDPARTLRARAQLLRDLRRAPEQDLPLEPCESEHLAWVETRAGGWQ